MNREQLIFSSFDEAADHILDVLSRVLHLDTLFIATNDGRTNRIIKAHNRSRQLVREGTSLPFKQAYCSLVPNSARGTAVIPSTRRHPAAAEMAVTKALGDSSFLGVPIHRSDGTLYGTLCAMDKPDYPFSDWEIRTLHSMAMFLAYVVELEAENVRQQKRSELLAWHKQETERQLQQLKQRQLSDQAKLDRSSDLLAMLSHEVRNSLNGTVGMTELMQQSPMTEEQQLYIRFMEESNKNLLQLLDNMLDYSKLDEGEMMLEVHPMDLLSTMEDSLLLYASQAQLKNLELLLDLDQELPLLYGDAGKIRQIVLNLLSNAIKFTDQGSVMVRVRSEPASDRHGSLKVLITVSDTGIGMADVEKDMLFRKYSRPHEDRRKQDPGSGLGLYISRMLAELMNGSLEASSESGKGSCFFLQLQLRAEPTPLVQLNHEPVSGRRVLLLGESEEQTNILSRLMSSWGVQVTSNLSPAESLQQLQREPAFDVLIVDHSFAESGAFLALLSEAELCSLPLIVITPLGVKLVPKLHEQAIGLLVKPVRRFYLMHTLTAALKRED
ncbi:ATP-binding protein [Paenibacillus pasadenensis]|uniref:ATP-binding protein n=1 Tax=Paenibacillus pasadenensis TaxID=217090 RepID=UPI00203BA996|nr:ATP-binding protein [Paenibacillus pasadenensis]MCM3748664.1 ATP-binding protein [Paenibacillus pasadenensis]